MKARSTVALCSIALAIMIGPQSALAAESINEAKKGLEAARSNLAKAVERIEKDPPTAADLDAARDAVEALKAAIEAGSELEPKDLEYAKAALAARKELRTQREYVEKRRAMAQLHESWRELDRARDRFDVAARRTEEPKASPKEFQEARAAATDFEKVIAGGQSFAAQDAKYAAHLTELKTALAERRKAIDERELHIAVQKQKALIDESRGAFSTALATLDNPKPTDAQLDVADAAATKLTKLLDEGRALERSDKDYRAFAELARDQISKGRKRIETVWGETGLANLKAEIDPVRADLVQASKAIHGKNPTTEQLAEARTAAIVLRKLVDKNQTRTSGSKPAAEYMVGVRKLLAETEVELFRRRVEPARDRVNEAMKAIAARDVADEAFVAAESTLKEAEQILKEGEPLEKDDRGYATFAQETRKRFAEAKGKITARKSEVEAGRVKSALEGAKRDLERAIRALDRRAPTDEQFGEAKSAAIVLEKTLETSHPKDAALVAYLRTAKSAMEKRRIEVEVDRQRAKVEAARSELAGLLAKASGSRDGAQLAEAEAAIERTKQVLAEGSAMASKDRNYATYDREVRKRLEEARARVTAERDRIAIDAQRERVDGALKALSQAIGALDGGQDKAAEITAVDKAIDGAVEAFASGADLERKLAAYANWSRQARKVLDASRTRYAKKKLALAAGDSRSQVKEKLAAAKAALESAKRPDAGQQEISAASAAVKALTDELASGESLEKEDRGYAAYATQVRRELERFETELLYATQAGMYRKETLDQLVGGAAAAEGAAKATTLRAQRDGYEKAMASFKACQKNGERILNDNPTLRATPVILDGQRIAGKDVIGHCVEHAKVTDQELRKVVGLLSFEEGPKASFEKGKALLAQSAKDDALAQFYECVSSGRILQHKNPELKDRKFEVAGGEMTLAQLIAACTSEAQRIKGK
jgi:hypothetical protein